MNWILIMVFWGAYTNTSSQIETKSKLDCEQAALQVTNQNKSKNGYPIDTYCVQVGKR